MVLSAYTRSAFCLAVATGLAIGCSSDSEDDPPPPETVQDAGGMDPADVGPPDSGPADTGTVDASQSVPCRFDQGGPENQGCNIGEVCNVLTGECSPGVACDPTQPTACNECATVNGTPTDCGHGYAVTAWCDPGHGSVCTRSRAPCEPCQDDGDCGLTHEVYRGNPTTTQNLCLDYAGGQKFCGRPSAIGCPVGYVTDPGTGQCRRSSCELEPLLCPEDAAQPGQQVAAGSPCGDGNGVCATNNAVGDLGFCTPGCRRNSDCGGATPQCDAVLGICIRGCTVGSCPNNQVCHMDARCAAPCSEDRDCFESTGVNSKDYGDEAGARGVYCNLPNRDEPKIFKGGLNGHRDANACVPLGCEEPTDCPGAGQVCNLEATPNPACVSGCQDTRDCSFGEQCKSGDPGQTYTVVQCRNELQPVTPGSGEIGVCCDPGCDQRALSCDSGQFCCGEAPYDDFAACLPEVEQDQANNRLCFDMSPPFCNRPNMEGVCAPSGWESQTGQAQAEQEFPFVVRVNMRNQFLCGITCDPNSTGDLLNGCPTSWSCQPRAFSCLADTDCSDGDPAVTCVGVVMGPNGPVPGRCKCGENGSVSGICGTQNRSFGGGIANPRCVDLDGTGTGDMNCIAAYNCVGPGAPNLYPAYCGLQ